MSSRNTPVLVAGASAVGLGLLYALSLSFSGSTTKGTSKSAASLTEIDDDEEGGGSSKKVGDYITPDDVVTVFDKLFLELQSLLSRIMPQLQQLKHQLGLPDAQLQALLKENLEKGLLNNQAAIVESLDMDYDCLEEATWEFLKEEEKYPQVSKAVTRFQRIWESATGEKVVGWRPGKTMKEDKFEVLSPDRTIEVAEIYFDSLTEAMRQQVDQIKAQGKSMKDPAVQQELNTMFSSNANDAGEAALKDVGVSMKQFEGSVKAHQNNRSVGQALAMLQMKQQQELMQLGNF